MPRWELTAAPVSPRAERPAEATVRALPKELAAAVRNATAGTVAHRERIVSYLARAVAAYDRHRYEEALRLIRPVLDEAPGVADVHELAGLAAYRAGQFPTARSHLLRYVDATGDVEHLPLVMDCDRVDRRFRALDSHFERLSAGAPSADALAEARIVVAASLADRRRFDDAIQILARAGAARPLRNPAFRHLRLWYALADVHDRAGHTSDARTIFERIVRADPEAYDAQARLEELGGLRPLRRNRRA